jgi:phage shock protein A
MGLLERVSTLIRANLNDMIDRAEDPEKLIKQVILDMDNQYLQVKTQVAVSIADQHMLEKKLHENEDAGREWMRKAELAVEKEQDDLARAGPFSNFAKAGAQLSRTGGRPEITGGNVEERADQAGTKVG